MENIEKILQDNMSYLEDNDLKGFYSALIKDEDLTAEDIGTATVVLEKCGIDTLTGLLQQGVKEVPNCYCYDNVVPDSLMISSVTMAFPDGIKVINYNAFHYAEIPGDKRAIVDLRGIREINENAFSNMEIREIKIDDKLKWVGNHAFANTDVVEIYHPSSMDKAEVRHLFQTSGLEFDNVEFISY